MLYKGITSPWQVAQILQSNVWNMEGSKKEQLKPY